MSQQTFALRDILMLFEEGVENVQRAHEILAKELEGHIELVKVFGNQQVPDTVYSGSSVYKTMLKSMKNSQTQIQIGLNRLEVALGKLDKGARLEEQKEKEKEKEKDKPK